MMYDVRYNEPTCNEIHCDYHKPDKETNQGIFYR